MTILTELELAEVARKFGNQLQAADIVLLSGPLGAGKTTFCRALLAGLGWIGTVKSPTFNLLNVYSTTPPVVHLDLYRLEKTTTEALGLNDYIFDHALLIEWPDRLSDLDPRAAHQIFIEFDDAPDKRRLTIVPPSG